jgi:hypothetical protein
MGFNSAFKGLISFGVVCCRKNISSFLIYYLQNIPQLLQFMLLFTVMSSGI